jgi:hypothetical protein
MIENLTTATPVEIDTVLFPLLADRWYHTAKRYDDRKVIAKTIWTEAFIEKFEKYLDRWSKHRTHAVANQYGWEKTLNHYNERINETTARLEGLQAEIDVLEAEYDRRGGWTRFLLVGGGHIHTQSQRCGSIRPTTQVMWLIEAAGMDADEVVRKYSYTACTKCFPNAPVATIEIDPKVCTAGPYDHSRPPHNRYAKCNACGYVGALTSTGKIRKHNKEGK